MYASIDEILDLKDFTLSNDVIYSQFPLTSDYKSLQYYSSSSVYHLPDCYSEFSYKEYDSFGKQLNKGFKFNTITESLVDIAEGEQFSFYDLMIQKEQIDLLESAKITDFNVMTSYSNNKDLAKQIENFLSNTLSSDNVIYEINKIILSLINNIIAVVNFDFARVSLMAQNEDLGNYFPSWHIDKTIAEENNLVETSTEYVFIIALKGSSTLYHSIDDLTRSEFFQIANESSHSYGYDKNLYYIKGQGLDSLFNILNSKTAHYCQGSVHIAGKQKGAVHSSPEGGERMILIITPIKEPAN